MSAATVLHVAAMPFPTRQGTQAVIHQMLTASRAAGTDAQLVSYAQAGHAAGASYPHHRIADFPRVRSLRSGPSLGKLVLDARLAATLPRLSRSLGASLWIAHHVEAALACLGRRPAVFFAHTDLGPELPSYAGRLPRAWLERAGVAFDTLVARAFGAVATVSPLLAERFAARLGDATRVRYVPAPWPLPPPEDPLERERARTELALEPAQRALLYAGNLDAYQSWDSTLVALARLRAGGAAAVLVVGTASDPAPLLARARALSLSDVVRVRALGDEPVRRALHAAADVALVPRGAEGGLPVKLLDALSRGVPVVLAPAARAGLALGDAACVARGGDGTALADAVAAVLARGESRAEVASRTRAWVDAHHHPSRYLAELDVLVRMTRG